MHPLHFGYLTQNCDFDVISWKLWYSTQVWKVQVSNISFVKTTLNISTNKRLSKHFFQFSIGFRILLSSEQAWKPAVPKLQLPDVGSWLPPAPPGERSPPPTLLPTQSTSPPSPLLVPSQPSPSLPGQPTCSPPQPSKPSTSRYGQHIDVECNKLFNKNSMR